LERTRRQLDDEEIAALTKRGQELVRNADFSSARLLLKRAAEAGSAAAALSLGETFDPRVLQQFHEIGVQADLAQARDWYERAARLGSDTAAQRLAKIAPPPQ
jgi:TPR repeat protein